MNAKSLSVICLCFAALGGAAMAYAENNHPETTIQDVKKESRELFATLKDYGADRHAEAMQKSREALAALDERIDVLESRIDRDWERMDHAARDKARAALRELHKQRIELAERFGRWKDSSVSAWEQLKQGFSKAYQDLEEAREKAEKEFGGER